MKIHLLTNCTSLKKNTIKEKVKLSDILITSEASEVVKIWLEKLEEANKKLTAEEVYAGDHWKVATNISAPNLERWVLSAGYGLINNRSKITSYDATFSTNSDNSISHIGISNSEWWNKIHTFRDRSQFGCESLNALVKENRQDKFFIAASPSYLRVIEKDLIELVSNGDLTEKNLFIISSKQSISDELKVCFYESKARFSGTIGGGRVSLNIRLAKYLLGVLTPEEVNKENIVHRYEELIENSPETITHQRMKMTDQEVKDFITGELQNKLKSKISASSLLSILRAKNLACEQKRFSRLLKESL